VLPESPSRYDNTVAPYASVDGSYEWVKLHKLVEPQALEGPVDWMALSDRYFAVVLRPDAETRKGTLAFSRIERGEADAFGMYYTVESSLAPGAGHTEQFTMYVGPKELSVLRDIDPSLTKLVNLGWFAFFGKILLAMLKFFHTLVDQWGVAIILLTFTVKAAFFPLTQASFKSSQAMSALQPDLQAIRDQFKDKPEEINRRTMELFRERGVNPLGGCLPMLVQLPVWIALYQVLLNSVELYHTEFLYFRDLSSVDPYGALPAVVMVLMVVQQQLTPMPNMDPAQARMMKILPIVFGIFFFAFPSGLVVYIFVNMVLTILQQWFIKRTYKQPAATVAATT
jgi:YidC/Oxa1 family membrane protein insertase